jgi:hypothetical protein
MGFVFLEEVETTLAERGGNGGNFRFYRSNTAHMNSRMRCLLLTAQTMFCNPFTFVGVNGDTPAIPMTLLNHNHSSGMTEDILAELPRGDIFVIAQVSLLVPLVQHFSFPGYPRISGAIEERMTGERSKDIFAL